jgi:hypothetical protein
LLGHAGVGFKHRTARAGKLRGVLLQARRDPGDIRYLVEAQTPDVGRAGHLLFEGSTIFFRAGGILNGDAAGKRHRKSENKSVQSHAGLLRIWRAWLGDPGQFQDKCGLARFAADKNL